MAEIPTTSQLSVVRFDADRLARYTAATAIAVVVAVAVVRRRPPAVRSLSMGPGGWVSFKGATTAPLSSAGAGRPWWARLLRARRLVVES